MDINVQRRLVHQTIVEVVQVEVVQVEVEVEAAAVVQAVLNVYREMAQLQICVLVGVVQNLARHQLG